LPGYWVVTDGLRRDFELFADATSRSSVDLLAKYGSGPGSPPGQARSTRQLIDQIDATITLRYKAEQDADVPDICKGRTYAQPFHLGLAMKTLVEWDTVHPDARRKTLVRTERRNGERPELQAVQPELPVELRLREA